MRAIGQQGFKWLGAITPIGGICFIAGWILMVIGDSAKKVKVQVCSVMVISVPLLFSIVKHMCFFHSFFHIY